MSGGKKDLTRIEDLSEYLHEDDEETDRLFQETQQKIEANSEHTDSSSPFDDEDEDTNQFQEFPGQPEESPEQEENSFDSSFDDSSEGSTDFESNDDFETPIEDNSFDNSDDFSSQEEDSSFEDNDQEDSNFDDAGEESSDFDSNDDFGQPDQEDSFEESENDNSSFAETQEEEATFDNQEQEEIAQEPEIEEVSEAEKIAESPAVSEPEPTPSAPLSAPAAEKFDDVKTFAKNITYSSIATGGNPPYSIMLKNIRYVEDANEISKTLEEYGILNDSSRKDIEQGLQNGALLISQISEYSAIFLAHKLRRFELDISVGLSEELHPSKIYNSNEIGLVSKSSIFQNHSEEINLEEAPTNFEDIFLATTPQLENFEIVKYIDIASANTNIDELDLQVEDGDDIKDQLPHVYHKLAEKLKKSALKLKGNAIVGVNYQITPLPLKKYKISCTGNVVWVSKRGESLEV